MKKILIIVGSLISVAALAFVITWCSINFNKVEEGMSGTGLYTKQELDKASEDSYNAALKDKEKYIVLINGYRDTIATLNDKVSQLNFQVNNLTSSNTDYKNQVNDLTAKKAELEDLIAKLQSSITYYETYVATLESDTQAVATYEYDGSIYAIQIMNKGTALSITDPVSTNRKHFNGWKVNGVLIDKDTYVLTQNTKFVADITYSFAVNFMVDENSYNGQFVVKNQTPTCPPEPVKDGYAFLGWSKNGVDIVDNISTIPVTEDTTYIAVFAKWHTVTFTYYDNDTVITQLVLDGNCAVAPELDLNKYDSTWAEVKSNQCVDILTYKIYSDTTFLACRKLGDSGTTSPIPSEPTIDLDGLK